MKVSVITTSFNKAWCLGRAIDSVKMQQTTFPFEIIIADDGSRDNSVFVARSHKRDVDRVISGSHVGLMRNFARAIDCARGEYIAFCDGDDYWIDPLKLQKQVDYMDAHLECGLCHTNVCVILDGVYTYPETPRELTLDMILRGGYIFAVTVMIRASLFPQADFQKAIDLRIWSPDYYVWIRYLHMSKLYKLEDVTAVYIVYPNSYSHTQSRTKRLKLVIIVAWFRAYFIYQYGCKLSTVLYLIYRLARDIYSVIFKRWYK